MFVKENPDRKKKKKFTPCSNVSVVNFEHLTAGLVGSLLYHLCSYSNCFVLPKAYLHINIRINM